MEHHQQQQQSHHTYAHHYRDTSIEVREEKVTKNEKKLNKFANVLLIIAFVLFVFGSGYRLGEYRTQQAALTTPLDVNISSDGKASFDLTLFWRVWSLMRSKYVYQDKIKPEKMLYGAIKGMVGALEDPYSFFLTPEENQQSKDDLAGHYQGIGAQLGLKDNKIIIIAPLKNSPAEKAGARAGDIIISVDKESTVGWSLNQAVEKIRGEKGTTVVLGIVRNGGNPFELHIKREEIKVESVELSYKKELGCSGVCPDIAQLKVNQFGDTTNLEWDKAVADIADRYQKGTVKGMVLDVRSNPGGYLEGSVYLAAEFLPENSRVVRQEYVDGSGVNYTTKREGKLRTIPLIVLIDKGSASASEILAGALRDYKRAVVIGEKSYGKGSVQEALNLDKGAGLHITVAKWVLPGGTWINGTGIKPAIEVKNEIKEGNTLTDETDAQLQRAFEEIMKR